MSEKQAGVLGRSDIYRIDPREVDIETGWNPRQDFGDLDSLAQSITENGVLMPILVQRTTSQRLSLIDGERRLKATLLAISNGAEIKSIPAFIRAKSFNKAQALLEAAIANDGKPFSSLELAEIYRRLKAWGWTQADIAKRVGRSQGHVSQTLSLLDASTPVREALIGGELKASKASGIVSKSRASRNPDEYQKEALAKAKSSPNGINARFASMTKKELNKLFGSIEEYRQRSKLSLSDDERQAFNLGRLSILCELSGKEASIEEIVES